MKKIILSAFITTALVGATFANTASPAFNGFYIGAGLTYSNGKIKNESSLLSQAGVQGTLGSSSKGAGITGFLGYGAILGGGFYLGGELGLGYDGSRFNNKSGGTGAFSDTKFKSGSKLVYSIAARLGYAVCNFLPYVKLGFEGRSDAKLQEDGQDVKFGNAGTVKARRNGLILGAGLDYAINKNVFIRGEYTHSFGSKSTYSLNNFKIVDFRTPTDTFLIGAAYKF